MRAAGKAAPLDDRADKCNTLAFPGFLARISRQFASASGNQRFNKTVLARHPDFEIMASSQEPSDADFILKSVLQGASIHGRRQPCSMDSEVGTFTSGAALFPYALSECKANV